MPMKKGIEGYECKLIPLWKLMHRVEIAGVFSFEGSCVVWKLRVDTPLEAHASCGNCGLIPLWRLMCSVGIAG
jgi:hypothetical protein